MGGSSKKKRKKERRREEKRAKRAKKSSRAETDDNDTTASIEATTTEKEPQHLQAQSASLTATEWDLDDSSSFGLNQGAPAATTFVYPREARGSKPRPYSFTKPTTRISEASNAEQAASTAVVEDGPPSSKKTGKKNETIEDIFASKTRTRDDAPQQKGSPRTTAAASEAAKAPSPREATAHDQQVPDSPKKHPDRSTPAEQQRARKAQEVEAESEHHGNEVTGLSVEDAVRDKVGCRPRSNSTDGELNLPRCGLCSERKVLESFEWKQAQSATSPPKGFVNLGNTCFLNATLQCLAFLPPLCQTLMSLPASATQNGKQQKISQGKRVTLMLRALFQQVHSTKDTRAITPQEIVRTVPSLGSIGSRNGYKFRPGRQEDAHEFLIHLLDAMNDGELRDAGINQHVSGWRDRLPIPRLDETTFIHRIFGGYFRSQVKCTACGHRSNTYDPFLDLALEVSNRSCHSIGDAIREFTRKETLDSNNRYKCSGCKKRVCATKQLTVFRPPLSLCLQLKRFAYNADGGIGQFGLYGYGHYKGFGGGRGGRKIAKPIQFPANLKLPLSEGRSCRYTLTGLVIHVGGSASSGHYTAYVKRPCGNGNFRWYHIDDSFVEIASEKTVLKQKDAYLLFYCRQEVRLEFPSPPLSMTAAEAAQLGKTRARARSLSFTESNAVVVASPFSNEETQRKLRASHSTSTVVGRKAEPEDGDESSLPTDNVTKVPRSPARKLPSESTGSHPHSGGPGEKDKAANPPVAPQARRTPSTTPDSTSRTSGSNASASVIQAGTERKRASSESPSSRVNRNTGSPSRSDSQDDSSSSHSTSSDSCDASSTEERSTSKARADVAKKPQTKDRGDAKRVGNGHSTAGDDAFGTKRPDNGSHAGTSSPRRKKTEGRVVPEDGTTSKPAETKRSSDALTVKGSQKVIQERGDGQCKLEVNVGAQYHRRNVWKPTSVLSRNGDGLGLLGTRHVDKWDDDEGAAAKPLVEGRGDIIRGVEQEQRKRKKYMHLDRWDSRLDQGKVSCSPSSSLCKGRPSRSLLQRKKIKRKEPNSGLVSNDPKNNRFQLLHAMRRGQHVQRPSSRKDRKGPH